MLNIKNLFKRKEPAPLTELEQIQELINLELLRQRFLAVDFQKGIYKQGV